MPKKSKSKLCLPSELIVDLKDDTLIIEEEKKEIRWFVVDFTCTRSMMRRWMKTEIVRRQITRDQCKMVMNDHIEITRAIVEGLKFFDR